MLIEYNINICVVYIGGLQRRIRAADKIVQQRVGPRSFWLVLRRRVRHAVPDKVPSLPKTLRDQHKREFNLHVR